MNVDRCSLRWAAAFAAVMLSAAPAAAQEDRQARVWAASCAACHGTDGRSQGTVASLAGRSRDDLLRVLLEFKAGKRPATVMHQHAAGYSEDELRRIAGVFAAHRP